MYHTPPSDSKQNLISHTRACIWKAHSLRLCSASRGASFLPLWSWSFQSIRRGRLPRCLPSAPRRLNPASCPCSALRTGSPGMHPPASWQGCTARPRYIPRRTPALESSPEQTHKARRKIHSSQAAAYIPQPCTGTCAPACSGLMLTGAPSAQSSGCAP